MSRHLSTRNVSSKSMHAFLSNLSHRQTDRQTERQTNKHGQKRIPPLLSEVTSTNNNNNKHGTFMGAASKPPPLSYSGEGFYGGRNIWDALCLGVPASLQPRIAAACTCQSVNGRQLRVGDKDKRMT